MVTWRSFLQGGSGWGIYGQRYNADGTEVGGEFRINTRTDNSQWEPSVAALADGGFVVTWQSRGQDGSGSGIYGQRYDADGTAAGGEFGINTGTADDQSFPSVTALADGGFVVTWESDGQDGSGWGIYGQRYDADGIEVGGEFRINTETEDDQERPSVTALADGGFVVTWTSDGQDGSRDGIYGQRFLVAGSGTGGDAEGDVLTGIENLRGSAHGDILTGDAGANVLEGGGGADVLEGGEGNDSLDGGADFDQARFDVASNAFTVTKEGDVYTIVSKEGVDTVTHVEEFVFSDTTLNAAQMDARAGTITADDRLLVGSDGPDTLTGGDGDDTISSGEGDDSIDGGAGNDWIFSGADNDTIDGGSGNDLLFGGAGADTFVFNSGHDSDVIHDFESGIDTLRLSGALTGGKSAADIVSTYATLTNGAVVFDFGGDDIITLSNLNALTGLAEDIEIF